MEKFIDELLFDLYWNTLNKIQSGSNEKLNSKSDKLIQDIMNVFNCSELSKIQEYELEELINDFIASVEELSFIRNVKDIIKYLS